MKRFSGLPEFSVLAGPERAVAAAVGVGAALRDCGSRG